MIRNMHDLVDVARYSRQAMRGDRVFGVHASPGVYQSTCFAAILTGNEMYWETRALYEATCPYEDNQSTPEGEIFPRLYSWESQWGTSAMFREIWQTRTASEGPPYTTTIHRRVSLALNLYETGARCDPHTRLALVPVPNNTPVIISIGPMPGISSPGGGPGPTLDVLVPWLFVWFAHYMDPPSCVCDYDQHVDRCI